MDLGWKYLAFVAIDDAEVIERLGVVRVDFQDLLEQRLQPIHPASFERLGRLLQKGGNLCRVAPDGGAYVSESDYFQADWQNDFWGANAPRLREVKRRYDPEGLFFTHHGIGSER